jgi:hypothetical protein
MFQNLEESIGDNLVAFWFEVRDANIERILLVV